MRKGPMNPDDLHERVDVMVAATNAFCAEHLTEEFGEMCANLTDELAMHHEDLLARGQPKRLSQSRGCHFSTCQARVQMRAQANWSNPR